MTEPQTPREAAATRLHARFTAAMGGGPSWGDLGPEGRAAWEEVVAEAATLAREERAAKPVHVIAADHQPMPQAVMTRMVAAAQLAATLAGLARITVDFTVEKDDEGGGRIVWGSAQRPALLAWRRLALALDDWATFDIGVSRDAARAEREAEEAKRELVALGDPQAVALWGQTAEEPARSLGEGMSRLAPALFPEAAPPWRSRVMVDVLALALVRAGATDAQAADAFAHEAARSRGDLQRALEISARPMRIVVPAEGKAPVHEPLVLRGVIGPESLTLTLPGGEEAVRLEAVEGSDPPALGAFVNGERAPRPAVVGPAILRWREAWQQAAQIPPWEGGTPLGLGDELRVNGQPMRVVAAGAAGASCDPERAEEVARCVLEYLCARDADDSVPGIAEALGRPTTDVSKVVGQLFADGAVEPTARGWRATPQALQAAAAKRSDG